MSVNSLLGSREGQDDDPNLTRDVWAVLKLVGVFAGAGLTSIVLFTWSCPDNRLASLGTALALMAAAGASGGLLGLLFGVPRALSQSTDGQAPSPGAPPADAAIKRPQNRSYTGNTNLEQISDWLTKVIVGATLVQLNPLSAKFGDLTARTARDLCRPNSDAFAGGLLIGSFVWGFFLGYLLTRRALPGLLARGEGGTLIKDADKTVVNTAMAALESSAPGAGGAAGAPPTPEATAAADKIASVPLSDLKPADFSVWGKAQILRKDFPSAIKALDAARAVDPRDAKVVERLMYAALYDTPPGGFRRAIEVGERFEHKTANINAYLAAAYGQNHRWEKARDPKSVKLIELRNKAFEAAQEAIRLDTRWKALLASFVEPHGDQDDDLETFANDDEFRKLVGLPPKVSG